MSSDDWSDRCKDDFSVAVSINLGQKGKWPTHRWSTALQVWSDQSFVLQSWHELKDLFPAADDKVIGDIAQPLSWWLQAVGKVFTDGELQFHGLIRRVLAMQTEELFEAGIPWLLA